MPKDKIQEVREELNPSADFKPRFKTETKSSNRRLKKVFQNLKAAHEKELQQENDEMKEKNIEQKPSEGRIIPG